jgi:hypothetical protein
MAVSKGIFTPIYLDAKINGMPGDITRGEPFKIRGSNMDMITEVDINGTKVAITPGKSSTTELSIPTTGLTLPDAVVVKVSKALGKIENGTSGSIKVINAGSFFVPVESIVLFNFEDGVDPFVNGDIAPTHSINGGGLASAGRGTKYLSVKAATVPSQWNTYIGGFKKANIDVSSFHKPYFTFLVNTNGKEGYFQLGITQNGKKGGTNFTAAATGVSTDNYKFKTNGWEWRSIPLEIQMDDWGNGGYRFDKNNLIEQLELSFKQGNGTNPFEINLDQIMITDGPQKPFYTVFDFENNVNPYSGSATSGLNLSGVAPISGAKYLTVRKSAAGSWDWTGAIDKSGPIDLSSASNAYVNFWINTNGKKGFFQMETFQNNVKWGGDLNKTDYMIQTNGWQLVSLRLADIQWSKWGGTGTATALDPKGSLEYFKIGFSTGNVTGEYEVNIDDVIFSDGPIF